MIATEHTQRITIERWHPTPANKLVGWHWAKIAKRKRSDRLMVAHYARDCTLTNDKRRVKLTIVLGKGQRGCDVDAYWKSLLDALVHAGVLVNDSKEYVELSPVEFVRGKQPGTIIELTDF